jgi:hypothetical protein
MPVFYARLAAEGGKLGVEPALASWDKAGSPGQARSAAFIDDVCAAVAEQVRMTPGPLALRLDVGLPDTVPLYALNDPSVEPCYGHPARTCRATHSQEHGRRQVGEQRKGHLRELGVARVGRRGIARRPRAPTAGSMT